MSEATSGISFPNRDTAPGCRFAHPGYRLRNGFKSVEARSVGGSAVLRTAMPGHDEKGPLNFQQNPNLFCQNSKKVVSQFIFLLLVVECSPDERSDIREQRRGLES